MTKIRYELGDKSFWKAQAKYNNRFDNVPYAKAIHGKSNRYANALIDDALALCGSPYYALSKRNWGADAIEFLRLFV